MVVTGTQLAFGAEESDFRLALDRLQKALSALNSSFDHPVMLHVYSTSPALRERVGSLLRDQKLVSPNTMLAVEGLPSLDARFGVDVIALAAR